MFKYCKFSTKQFTYLQSMAIASYPSLSITSSLNFLSSDSFDSSIVSSFLSLPLSKHSKTKRILQSFPTPCYQSKKGLKRIFASASENATITPISEEFEQTSSDMSGEDFIRPHLRTLAAYTPIEPFEILSAKLGRDPKDIVKLDANENPYGPPPEVLEALGSMEFPYIYPDPECRGLRKALAEDCGIGMENILVGCGADELIDLIMRCTLDPGDSIVDCPPTFTMYAFDAAVNDARVLTVPRLSNFEIDLKAVKATIHEHKPKIIFLTSPNNPDGSLLDDEILKEILKLPILVVLDEAYIEFSHLSSKMNWVYDYENIIVLRTFSKRAGLAGLRVGYGAFPSSLIPFLWKAKQPYNVSVAAEVAACAALKNPDYLKNVKEALVDERKRLMGFLKKIAFLEPYPSYANFILCNVVGDRSAADVKNALMEQGIMVRHYNKPELKNFIRISVGKPQQTDVLIHALNNLA